MPWWRSARTPEIDGAQLGAIIEQNVGLASRLATPERERLADLTVELIRAKDWEAANGFTLTPEITVTLAANAAIPVLAIGLGVYDRVHTIIVRPTAVRSGGLRSGPSAGTVSDDEVWTDGLSLPDRGPLAISWDAARHESRHPSMGRNVVVHEFAHKIDMRDGLADGTPPMRGPSLANWVTLLADEYGHPEHRQSDDVLQSYAWANPAEFFAVATEAFFCIPLELRAAKPTLYQAFAEFYRQDPARQTDPA